jgi:hypothetical protein
MKIGSLPTTVQNHLKIKITMPRTIEIQAYKFDEHGKQI